MSLKTFLANLGVATGIVNAAVAPTFAALPTSSSTGDQVTVQLDADGSSAAKLRKLEIGSEVSPGTFLLDSESFKYLRENNLIETHREAAHSEDTDGR